MIYLYLKTHNITNLKYLGYTRRDPHLYKGSGVYWQRHIKKHGYDVTTQILLINDIQAIVDTGIFFSKIWNIVESNEYANLCEESGQGGITWNDKHHRLGTTHTHDTILKMSQSKMGKRHKCYDDKHYKSISIIIDGISYPTYERAGIELNIKWETIRHRVNSKSVKYTNYYFKNEREVHIS